MTGHEGGIRSYFSLLYAYCLRMTMYEHTQPGYVTAGTLGLAAVLVFTVVVALDEPRSWVQGLCSGLSLAFVVGAFLLSSLTVEVTSEWFRFAFGPGFWEKEIPIRRIADVRPVRNPVYYGWGVRYTSDGWLYTVSGLRAVELEMEDGQTLRVGTDEPERLHRALKRALASE